MSGHGSKYADDDDENKADLEGGAARRFKEFECPECNAHNPWDETFGMEDEIRCNYCGVEYRAIVSDEGRLKLKEI